MTATTTTHHTLSIRPALLAALLATTVAASVGATWGTLHLDEREGTVEQPAPAALAPMTQAYVEGVASMTPAQLAAAYGYNNYPDTETQAYIDGITDMTPAELAAAYGYNNYPSRP